MFRCQQNQNENGENDPKKPTKQQQMTFFMKSKFTIKIIDWKVSIFLENNLEISQKNVK